MKRIALFFLLVAFTLLLNAQRLTYTSRALGNTDYKCVGPHMQNHIEDMNVSGDGTCTTYSVWDEGFHPQAAYKDGAYIGQASYTANSKSVKDKSGKTWTIQNYYGRFLNATKNSYPILRIDPVPTGSNAPYISCSDGRTITSILDPGALGINLKTGELLVADNSSEQNVKIFDISGMGTPVQVGTFGKPGGVFADSIPGRTTDMLRFRGVTGLGGDNEGNIYIAMDGFPGGEGSGGGAEIRAFNPNGTLRWKMVGFLFVAAGCVDPASLDGTEIYEPYHHFKMDYSKPQGSDWELTAITINPFLYPNDSRLVSSITDGFAIKNINGKKYGFFTDMTNNHLWVYRFNGEIAVPCAAFCVAFGWNGDEVGVCSWNYTRGRPATDINNRRWLWTDKNGDGSGLYQPEEYSIYNFPDVRILGLDVDNEGNIYLGSEDNGNVYKFPTNGFDSNGNPRYSTASMEVFANVGHGAEVMKWVQETDMFFVSNDNNNITQVDIWQNWGSPSRSKVRTVPVKPALSGNTARQVTADKDYFYVVYMMDGGPSSGGKTGEIGVYKISDGSFVGYIIPGPEVGSCSSWIDMNTPVKIHVTPTGKRIITSEDDLVGKIFVYEWCPTGDCSQPICSSTVDSVVVSPTAIDMIGNDTTAFSVRVYPDSVCVKNVSWISSNTNVATVDYQGKVISTGVGSAWIKCSSDLQTDKSDSTLVTVQNLPVTNFELHQDSIELPVREKFQLTNTIQPIHALNKAIIWKSKNETIAAIDSTGKVTAVDKGQTLITAKTEDGNIIDSCVVTVYSVPATSITVIPSELSIWEGDILTLRTQIQPDVTTNKSVNWRSLNPLVASINTEGILEGIAEGQAEIIASTSDNALNDTCVVNVVPTTDFAHRDIGNPCAQGNAVLNNGSIEITAGGDDIGGNRDQFHMVYKKWKGDGQIIAKVSTYNDPKSWAKFGVMMRETLNAASKEVSMCIVPGNGCGSVIIYRPNTIDITSYIFSWDAKVAPYWVRLVRQGNRFTGYTGVDGKTWKTIGAINISMADTLFVGFCVSANDVDCGTKNGIFENVSIGSKTSSVDDVNFSEDNFEVYPNPLSQGFLTVNLPEEAIRLSIVDLTGKVVYQQQVVKNEFQIDKSVFKSAGVYIVNVVTEKGTMNKKIIITK